MAFVFTVEDGDGLEAANAYITEAEADDYHEGRGHTDWAALSSEAKQGAIVRATDYIDKRFGRRFRGFKSSSAQALEWPRIDATDNDDYLVNPVPRALVKACAEYALISARQGELAPAPNLPIPDEAVADGASTSTSIVTGEIKSKTEKVGPLQESTSYVTSAEIAGGGSNRSSQSRMVEDVHLPEYPVADLWIEELLVPAGGRTVDRA